MGAHFVSARLLAAMLAILLTTSADASDWLRFRGPNGAGASPDGGAAPTTWSETENLRWSTQLPGPGLSSPIVHGDKVFVTSWTGYAAGPGSSDDPQDLKRALVCVDRTNGKILWTKSVAAAQPVETFQGMFAENGYASHTPVTDGQRVFAFFGKSGVVAFDMQGEQLWQTNVGSGEGMMGWGTASSPILYKNLVIVTAAAESRSLIALDQATGKEVWRQEADGLTGTWSTPILVEADGRTDLVLAVPYEIWGVNPDTGKLRWFCDSVDSNSACASTVVKDGVIYFVGGRDGGSVAVRAGGKGDVGETHVEWRGRHRSRIGTPLVDGDNLYWVSRNIATCIRLSDGEEVYEERLNSSSAGANGGGRGRGQDYSSPVAADGKLYFVTRDGTTFVLALGEFKQLAVNRFASDESDYSATPAIVDGQVFIRSNEKLYCVQAE